MKDYLIFKLYGPMMSWGDIAIGSVRPTYNYPTKSAIMGLIAAALGIKREDEEKLLELQNEINFSVRIDAFGEIMDDYHTVQFPSESDVKKHGCYTRKDYVSIKDQNTILSYREYVNDYLYTIILSKKGIINEFNLPSIKYFLKNPYFILFLGRKCCPISFPIHPIIVNAENIKLALKIADPLMQEKESGIFDYLKSEYMQLYWENEKNYNLESIEISKKDKLASRKRWQYQEREEYCITYKSEENLHVL